MPNGLKHAHKSSAYDSLSADFKNFIDASRNLVGHAKAYHWLEDGMNIVRISFLLGHANLHTIYLDITTEQESKA